MSWWWLVWMVVGALSFLAGFGTVLWIDERRYQRRRALPHRAPLT